MYGEGVLWARSIHRGDVLFVFELELYRVGGVVGIRDFRRDVGDDDVVLFILVDIGDDGDGFGEQ